MAVSFTQQHFEEIVNRVLQEMTQRIGGISLSDSTQVEMQHPFTVYSTFTGDEPIRLALCADYQMFRKIANYMASGMQVEGEDVELFASEYFNVVCGQIASSVFYTTHKAIRFTVPQYCEGCCVPQGAGRVFVKSYQTAQGDHAQVIGF